MSRYPSSVRVESFVVHSPKLTVTRDLRGFLLDQVCAHIHLPLICMLTTQLSWSGLLVAYALEILPFRLRAKGLMIMNITVQAILAVGNQTNPVAWANLPKHWVRSSRHYVSSTTANQGTRTSPCSTRFGFASNWSSSTLFSPRQRYALHSWPFTYIHSHFIGSNSRRDLQDLRWRRCCGTYRSC